MVNPDHQNEFKKLRDDFREIWRSSDGKIRGDNVFIVRKIAEWTNKDVSLSEILFDFFKTNINYTSIIPDTINEENINQVEEKVIEHLKQDPSIKNELQKIKEQITTDSSSADLVKIVQQIWNRQSNDQSIPSELSDKDKIDKLIDIGLVKKDDKGNPIPINWIYKKLFSLDDLVTSRTLPPETHPPSRQDPDDKKPTKTGLHPRISGLIIVPVFLFLIGMLVRQYEADHDQARDRSDGRIQTVNQECSTISNKLSLKDLIAGNSSNGDKDLIIKRDRAITDIEKFLSQQPQKKSLGEICGENYGTRYAELLYDQAIAVASQAYSPSTYQIKYSRREDALCLIREKDIQGSKKYTFQQVKDLLKKWEATCPN
jgi:hypothetical protein